MQAPRVDFRDLAAQANLTGIIISGEPIQQTYVASSAS